jgi:hypothetical protein
MTQKSQLRKGYRTFIDFSFFLGLLFLFTLVPSRVLWAETHTFEGVRRPYQNPGCDNIRGSIKGQYQMGLIGPTCPAFSMGTTLRAELLYENLIVDGHEIAVEPDINNKKRQVLTETSLKYVANYGVQMANLIDQMASDFLFEQAALESGRRQGALPTPEEIEAWQLLVKVFAYQESLLTHYQYSDGDENEDHKLRVLVGDPAYARVCEGDAGERRCRVRRDERGRAQILRDKNGNLVYSALGMYQIHSSSSNKRTLLERSDQLDLVKNIESGMIYAYPRWAQVLGYRHFQSAALKSRYQRCRSLVHTQKGINYNAAIRAAYSMYNGGDSDICRFHDSDIKNKSYQEQNPGCYVGRVAFRSEAQKRNCEAKQKCGVVACPWVNDTRIAALITKKPWQETLQITDEKRKEKFQDQQGRYKFAFDLSCARRGDSICLLGEDPEQSVLDYVQAQSEPKLYTLVSSAFQKAEGKENFCVFDHAKKEFLCTQREDLVTCLRNKQDFPLSKVKTSKKVGRAYYTLYRLPLDAHDVARRVSNDILELCSGSEDGVFLPGEVLVVLKNSKLLKEARLGSVALANVAANSQLQILDVKIDTETGLDRWYKVAVVLNGGQIREGYIYGGDDLDWSSYVAPIVKAVEPKGVPLRQLSLRLKSSNHAAMQMAPHHENVLQVLPVPGQKIRARQPLPVYSTLDELANDLDNLNIEDFKKIFQSRAQIETGQIAEVLKVHLHGDSRVVILQVRVHGAEPAIHFVRVGQLRSLLKTVSQSIQENVEILSFE